jgi:hypothetical protein
MLGILNFCLRTLFVVKKDAFAYKISSCLAQLFASESIAMLHSRSFQIWYFLILPGELQF